MIDFAVNPASEISRRVRLGAAALVAGIGVLLASLGAPINLVEEGIYLSESTVGCLWMNQNFERA